MDVKYEGVEMFDSLTPPKVLLLKNWKEIHEHPKDVLYLTGLESAQGFATS